MSVTLFNAGITITDDMAARLSAFAEAVFLAPYQAAHDGTNPPGWPDPASHKALAEWGIKRTVKTRLLRWERQMAEDAISIDPWAGGDVEGGSR